MYLGIKYIRQEFLGITTIGTIAVQMDRTEGHVVWCIFLRDLLLLDKACNTNYFSWHSVGPSSFFSSSHRLTAIIVEVQIRYAISRVQGKQAILECLMYEANFSLAALFMGKKIPCVICLHFFVC